MGARHLLLGYLAGGVVRGLLIGVATLAFARLLVDYPLREPLVLAVTLVAVSVAFAALGVVVGLLSKGWEFQSVVGSLVIQPLVFLGGVFYWSPRSMTRGVSSPIADPLYYIGAGGTRGHRSGGRRCRWRCRWV